MKNQFLTFAFEITGKITGERIGIGFAESNYKKRTAKKYKPGFIHLALPNKTLISNLINDIVRPLKGKIKRWLLRYLDTI